MKTTTVWMFTTLLALALPLAGCGSSEPSEDDMFEAIAAWDQSGQMFGSPSNMKKDTKKLGCEKTGEKSYKCMIGSRDGKGMALPMTFTTGDDRWLVMPAH